VGDSYLGPSAEATDKGVCGSERDVDEYVSFDSSADTNVRHVFVGSAIVEFDFPDVGWKALVVCSFE
jgi:hypothetical protein